MRARFTVMVVISAVAVLLSACGGGSVQSDLEAVKEAKVLKVGTEGTSAPCS